MKKLNRSAFALSILIALLCVGCSGKYPPATSTNIDASDWDERNFEEVCLSGIYYYLRAPNFRGYMAVVIDRETLKPKLCDT